MRVGGRMRSSSSLDGMAGSEEVKPGNGSARQMRDEAEKRTGDETREDLSEDIGFGHPCDEKREVGEDPPGAAGIIDALHSLHAVLSSSAPDESASEANSSRSLSTPNSSSDCSSELSDRDIGYTDATDEAIIAGVQERNRSERTKRKGKMKRMKIFKRILRRRSLMSPIPETGNDEEVICESKNNSKSMAGPVAWVDGSDEINEKDGEDEDSAIEKSVLSSEVHFSGVGSGEAAEIEPKYSASSVDSVGRSEGIIVCKHAISPQAGSGKVAEIEPKDSAYSPKAMERSEVTESARPMVSSEVHFSGIGSSEAAEIEPECPAASTEPVESSEEAEPEKPTISSEVYFSGVGSSEAAEIEPKHPTSSTKPVKISEEAEPEKPTVSSEVYFSGVGSSEAAEIEPKHPDSTTKPLESSEAADSAKHGASSEVHFSGKGSGEAAEEEPNLPIFSADCGEQSKEIEMLEEAGRIDQTDSGTQSALKRKEATVQELIRNDSNQVMTNKQHSTDKKDLDFGNYNLELDSGAAPENDARTVAKGVELGQDVPVKDETPSKKAREKAAGTLQTFFRSHHRMPGSTSVENPNIGNDELITGDTKREPATGTSSNSDNLTPTTEQVKVVEQNMYETDDKDLMNEAEMNKCLSESSAKLPTIVAKDQAEDSKATLDKQVTSHWVESSYEISNKDKVTENESEKNVPAMGNSGEPVRMNAFWKHACCGLLEYAGPSRDVSDTGFVDHSTPEEPLFSKMPDVSLEAPLIGQEPSKGRSEPDETADTREKKASNEPGEGRKLEDLSERESLIYSEAAVSRKAEKEAIEDMPAVEVIPSETASAPNGSWMHVCCGLGELHVSSSKILEEPSAGSVNETPVSKEEELATREVDWDEPMVKVFPSETNSAPLGGWTNGCCGLGGLHASSSQVVEEPVAGSVDESPVSKDEDMAAREVIDDKPSVEVPSDTASAPMWGWMYACCGIGFGPSSSNGVLEESKPSLKDEAISSREALAEKEGVEEASSTEAIQSDTSSASQADWIHTCGGARGLPSSSSQVLEESNPDLAVGTLSSEVADAPSIEVIHSDTSSAPKAGWTTGCCGFGKPPSSSSEVLEDTTSSLVDERNANEESSTLEKEAEQIPCNDCQESTAVADGDILESAIVLHKNLEERNTSKSVENRNTSESDAAEPQEQLVREVQNALAESKEAVNTDTPKKARRGIFRAFRLIRKSSRKEKPFFQQASSKAKPSSQQVSMVDSEKEPREHSTSEAVAVTTDSKSDDNMKEIECNSSTPKRSEQNEARRRNMMAEDEGISQHGEDESSLEHSVYSRVENMLDKDEEEMSDNEEKSENKTLKRARMRRNFESIPTPPYRAVRDEKFPPTVEHINSEPLGLENSTSRGDSNVESEATSRPSVLSYHTSDDDDAYYEDVEVSEAGICSMMLCDLFGTQQEPDGVEAVQSMLSMMSSESVDYQPPRNTHRNRRGRSRVPVAVSTAPSSKKSVEVAPVSSTLSSKRSVQAVLAGNANSNKKSAEAKSTNGAVSSKKPVEEVPVNSALSMGSEKPVETALENTAISSRSSEDTGLILDSISTDTEDKKDMRILPPRMRSRFLKNNKEKAPASEVKRVTSETSVQKILASQGQEEEAKVKVQIWKLTMTSSSHEEDLGEEDTVKVKNEQDKQTADENQMEKVISEVTVVDAEAIQQKPALTGAEACQIIREDVGSCFCCGRRS